MSSPAVQRLISTGGIGVSLARSSQRASLSTGVGIGLTHLEIFGRCECGDSFCATFYTDRRPDGAYGPGHRNVVVDVKKGMVILDVVDGRIACVEVLHRGDVRRELAEAYR